MDNRNKHGEQLGVNKMGKNIRKSPLHEPNFVSNTNRQQQQQQPQQPQPQVYNINKNDFRNVVQRLTGSPSHEPLPRPPHNPPKPPSMRLQRIRPPPLSSMNRPQIPIHHHHPAPPQPPPMSMQPVPYGNAFARSPNQFGQLSPTMLPLTPGDGFSSVNSGWGNTAESPISAYVRYLQNSIIDSGPRQIQPQTQPQFQPQPQLQQQSQVSSQIQDRPQTSAALLPYPLAPSMPSPRMSGPPPPLLPSPTSQFLLPSPSGYLNLMSPRSPYPLLSPGYHFPPPLTPNFAFSPMAHHQSGILGPGPQPPLSPGIGFPSPGFFSISSPGWRDP
ncbi:hypothetical protein RHSIM_Rhsim07G0126700 [Rhododendron simsii]|uniref:VQ domain-containing protein n=1 Tax=Rhododendron simsii TaxID=118357 RepID=A0A834GTT2_RHOSS|nr:hypothetical protein RHSIM_Rhsim07G0126700 [Rhododendron simsii]